MAWSVWGHAPTNERSFTGVFPARGGVAGHLPGRMHGVGVANCGERTAGSSLEHPSTPRSLRWMMHSAALRSPCSLSKAARRHAVDHSGRLLVTGRGTNPDGVAPG